MDAHSGGIGQALHILQCQGMFVFFKSWLLLSWGVIKGKEGLFYFLKWRRQDFECVWIEMEDQNKIPPFVYHLHAGFLFSCLAYRTHPRCSIKHFAVYTVKLPRFALSCFAPFSQRCKKKQLTENIKLGSVSIIEPFIFFSCLCLRQEVSQLFVELKGKVKYNNLKRNIHF